MLQYYTVVPSALGKRLWNKLQQDKIQSTMYNSRAREIELFESVERKE